MARHGSFQDVLARTVAEHEGVRVQVREKDLAADQLFALATAARACCDDLFINDRLDVAMAVGADGVHLPEAGLAAADVRRLWPSGRISLSWHHDAAPPEIELMDAVHVGPVFATPSKARFGPPRGLSAVSLAKQTWGTGASMIGVGGINLENARGVQAAGADGIAVIGSVWDSPDPPQTLRNLLHLLNK